LRLERKASPFIAWSVEREAELPGFEILDFFYALGFF